MCGVDLKSNLGGVFGYFGLVWCCVDAKAMVRLVRRCMVLWLVCRHGVLWLVHGAGEARVVRTPRPAPVPRLRVRNASFECPLHFGLPGTCLLWRHTPVTALRGYPSNKAE